MSNWFKKAQEVQLVTYMGSIEAKINVPFGGEDREYSAVSSVVGMAMQAAERAASQMGISCTFTPQGDYQKRAF